MHGFKLAPFPCPFCEHQILVDLLDSNVEINDGVSSFTVTRTLDMSGPELYPDEPRGQATISRRELLRENEELRGKLRVQALPWWRRIRERI